MILDGMKEAAKSETAQAAMAKN